MERKDTFPILAGQSQLHRLSACRQNKEIVGKPLPGGEGDDALCRIDTLYPCLGVDINPIPPEVFRGTDHQTPIVVNYITDVIGHRSSGVGDKLSSFDHGNRK